MDLPGHGCSRAFCDRRLKGLALEYGPESSFQRLPHVYAIIKEHGVLFGCEALDQAHWWARCPGRFHTGFVCGTCGRSDAEVV